MTEPDIVQTVSFLTQNSPVLNLPLDPLHELKYQRRRKKSNYSMPESKMMGADTETVEGKVWLFSTEAGVWEIEDFDSLLEVLYNREHATVWKQGRRSDRAAKRGISTKEFFFWNLGFDAGAILRLFSPEMVDSLLVGDKVVIRAFCEGGEGINVEVKYLLKKYMEIKPLNWMIDDRWQAGVCKFWDISQFFGKMPLKTAAELYGFPPKIERCADGSILDVTQLDDEEYRTKYRTDIEKYAIHDAVLAGELARLKRNSLIQSGIRFNQPYSEANVAQRALMDTPCCDDEICAGDCEHPIPTINEYIDNPKLHHLLAKALTSYAGGWFECSGNGYIADVSAVDLASAYAYAQWHLPNTAKGYWVQRAGTESFFDWLDERQPLELGFAEVQILFDEGLNWHPLIKKAPSGTLVSPRLIKGWFTADELAEARQWPHSNFTVGEWICFRESDSTDRPFQPFLDRFYQMKMNAGVRREGCECGTCEPCVDYQNSKTMICSTYGKTIQAVDGKTGLLWNPFWAATICGFTRSRLAEINRLNDFKAVSLATDGIIFRTEDLHKIPARPLPACHNLGEWEPEGNGELLVVQSGVYSLRMTEKVKTVFRGSASYFLRPYRDEGLFGFVNDNESERMVRTIKSMPYSAKEARIRNDYSLINRFRDRPFSMQPKGDSLKRLWGFTTSRTFGDLLTNWFKSRPHFEIETSVIPERENATE